MCSTRPRMRRGGRARVSRCSTNARSGGSSSGTLRGSTPRRDTDLFRLRVMGATIWIAARPNHRTAVGSRLRSEEHTSELQSRGHLVCRLLLEKKKKKSCKILFCKKKKKKLC